MGSQDTLLVSFKGYLLILHPYHIFPPSFPPIPSPTSPLPLPNPFLHDFCSETKQAFQSVTYHVIIRLSTSPCIIWARQSSLSNIFSRASHSVWDRPWSHCQESYKQTKLHNCHLFVEGYLGSLVVSSNSVSSYDRGQLLMWAPL